MSPQEQLHEHLDKGRQELSGLDWMVLPYWGQQLLKTCIHLVGATEAIAQGLDLRAIGSPSPERPNGAFCQQCGCVSFSASADPRVCPRCLIKAMTNHKPPPTGPENDVVAAYLLEWLLRHYSADLVQRALEERARQARPPLAEAG